MTSQPSPLPARNLMTGIDGAMSDPRAPDTFGGAKLDVGLLPVRPEMFRDTSFGPPQFIKRNQAPGTVIDLETGLPPVKLPEITDSIGGGGRGGFSNIRQLPRSGMGALPVDEFMPGSGLGRFPQNMPVGRPRGPRRLPQIMPERRMPQQRPSNRFFGGGLRSIFSRLPNQRVRRGMSPPLPRAPLPMPPRFPRTPMPMPERMPRGRFPIIRPGFAEGEDVDMNMIIAEQGAREGMSPPEMAAQRIKEFLGETGRTVSNRDAELFGMGMLTLEDIMQRAEPVTNRNLEQQEQLFFPESESLDDILADLEKKN